MLAPYTREDLWNLVMTTARDAAVNLLTHPRRAAIARAARSSPAVVRSVGGNYDEAGDYHAHFRLDGSKLDGTDVLR